jgi:hypothetical protein
VVTVVATRRREGPPRGGPGSAVAGAEAHQVLTTAPGGGAGLAHAIGEVLEDLQVAAVERLALVAEDAQQLSRSTAGGELDVPQLVLESGDRGGFASVDRAPPTGEPVDHPALSVTEQLLDGADNNTNRSSAARV